MRLVLARSSIFRARPSGFWSRCLGPSIVLFLLLRLGCNLWRAGYGVCPCSPIHSTLSHLERFELRRVYVDSREREPAPRHRRTGIGAKLPRRRQDLGLRRSRQPGVAGHRLPDDLYRRRPPVRRGEHRQFGRQSEPGLALRAGQGLGRVDIGPGRLAARDPALALEPWSIPGHHSPVTKAANADDNVGAVPIISPTTRARDQGSKDRNGH